MNNCKQLRIIKQKDRLELSKIRKFMNDCRKARAPPKVQVMNAQQIETLVLKQKSDKLNGSNNPNFLKIQMMKDLKQKHQQELEAERKLKEAVLVRFFDNSSQVLSEAEFMNFCIRRKDDPIWNNVSQFQNYIATSKIPYGILQIEFNYLTDYKDPLFVRAKSEVNQINGDVSPLSEDYICIHQEIAFEELLLREDPTSYLRYLVYKITYFVEVFHSSRIICGVFEFQKDDDGVYQLVNAFNIKHQFIKSHHLTTEMFYKMLEDRTEKAFMKITIPAEKLKEAENHERVIQMQNFMNGNFESAKKSCGIEDEVERLDVQDASDDAFKMLHPESPSKLSSLLKNKNLFNQYTRQFIWNEDRPKPSRQISGIQNKMFDMFVSSPETTRRRSRTIALKNNTSTIFRGSDTKSNSRSTRRRLLFLNQTNNVHESANEDINNYQFMFPHSNRRISRASSHQRKSNTLTYYLFGLQ